MCDYSSAVANAAANNQAIEDIKNLMKSTGWTVEEAMSKLGVASDKREEYAEEISNSEKMVTV